MATEDINGESPITTDEKEEKTDEVPEALASEELEEPECTELKESTEECTELKESIEAENSVSDTMEADNSPEAAIEDGQKEEGSAETIDTKVAENIESSAEGTTDSIEPSTTTPTPDESKLDDESKKMLERRRRGRRGGRGVMVQKLASLKLPDGVILVRDRRYTGYHCTYCNCVLRSLATVKAHVDGKWHKRTLQIKVIHGDKKKTTTPSKSPAAAPIEKAPPKVPLKSSLEEYFSTTTTAIVGLGYIIETQRPNKKPTFQCNLCEVSCDSDDIKEHINGMKHCLMYLKLVKPAKLAELLAKQLSKAEKNKEIANLSEELERENGRGEITVKTLQPKTMTVAAKQPGNRPPNQFQRGGNRALRGGRGGRALRGGRGGRALRGGTGGRAGIRPQVPGNISNKPAAQTSNANQRNRNYWGARRGNLQKPAQQKRRNEGMSPAQKRQLLERDFQARVQYSMERAQNSFYPGGWDMGNEAMNMAPYQSEANFYPNYPNFYSNSYGERRPLNRQRYTNEPYERMDQLPERELYRRERYDDRQPYWSDHRDNFAPIKPRNYNNRSVSQMRKGAPPKDQISAIKHLAGFNVASEEDAGVVINAINSLTNSFMNYKLRDLSGPVQQLLQKSLKGNDLQSLLDLPDKSVGNTRDRYGGRSSQMDRDWGITQIAKPQNWLF